MQGIPTPPPPAPAQAGQQAQQQQQQQAHVAPQAQVPAAQGQQVVLFNWSYFKPDFSGKPDEDAETHLLWTIDWMNAHHFIEGIKVQRF